MENNSITLKKETISILGCGWYGLALAKRLITAGYLVKGSTTSPEKLELLSSSSILPFLLNFQEHEVEANPEFFNTEILVIAIPPKRNTAEQASFSDKIQKIAVLAERYKVQQLVFISSTAVYGESNSEITEASLAIPDTASGKAMLEAEQFLTAQLSFSTTILRFAGLIGPGRNPGKFFAGKQDIPNGQAPVNLLHQEDSVEFTLALIQQAAFGRIYNVCSPDHPSRQEFYTKAAQQSQLPLPSFIDELLKWKIISSNVSSSILNYQYRITNFSK